MWAMVQPQQVDLSLRLSYPWMHLVQQGQQMMICNQQPMQCACRPRSPFWQRLQQQKMNNTWWRCCNVPWSGRRCAWKMRSIARSSCRLQCRDIWDRQNWCTTSGRWGSWRTMRTSMNQVFWNKVFSGRCFQAQCDAFAAWSVVVWVWHGFMDERDDSFSVSGWTNHRQNSAVLQSVQVKLVEQQRHADVGQLSSMLTRGRRLASELQTVQWVMPHKLHSLYVFVGMTLVMTAVAMMSPNQRFNPGGRGGFTADVGAATLKTPPGWSSRAVELILYVPGWAM